MSLINMTLLDSLWQFELKKPTELLILQAKMLKTNPEKCQNCKLEMIMMGRVFSVGKN